MIHSRLMITAHDYGSWLLSNLGSLVQLYSNHSIFVRHTYLWTWEQTVPCPKISLNWDGWHGRKNAKSLFRHWARHPSCPPRQQRQRQLLFRRPWLQCTGEATCEKIPIQSVLWWLWTLCQRGTKSKGGSFLFCSVAWSRSKQNHFEARLVTRGCSFSYNPADCIDKWVPILIIYRVI